MSDALTTLSKNLRQSKDELASIDQQIAGLRSRRRELTAKIETLESQLKVKQQNSDEFFGIDFSWSTKIQTTLQSVFKLKSLRPLQLATINASMSGRDVILVLPTGGGKSLCFQLPAAISSGLTVVVSPLIALMEDQLNQMRMLNINTAVVNSTTPKEEKTSIIRRLADDDSDIKMVYVTPEMISKSKRLMAQIEKLYRCGRLTRLVIDEVHCCSDWGHDFRTDYQFLGIFKRQFPETPILGLTAVATETVILDVQKILNVEGCLVLKDNFYRDNLRYFVESIADSRDELITRIASLLKGRFKSQSGLIYCLTIKDTEEVARKLATDHGIAARAYHAQMPGEDRSKVQSKWYLNKVQVIVATVAFGMGINKLDLRFVIHFSMSKSLENYYQETGRAGRDGQLADCLLFYKFSDVFRTTSLTFTEKTGVQNAYSMAAFCLNRSDCRKEQIARHFGDNWNRTGCDSKCDNCLDGNVQLELIGQQIDVTKDCRDLIAILTHADKIQERMTPLKLLDSWTGKGNKKLRLDSVRPPKMSRTDCEAVIVRLLIDGYFKEDFHFTPYSTISYLIPGFKRPVVGQPMVYFLNHSPSKKRLMKSFSESENQTKAKKIKKKNDSKKVTEIINLE